jgi:hypothetical protein
MNVVGVLGVRVYPPANNRIRDRTYRGAIHHQLLDTSEPVIIMLYTCHSLDTFELRRLSVNTTEPCSPPRAFHLPLYDLTRSLPLRLSIFQTVLPFFSFGHFFFSLPSGSRPDMPGA